MGVMVMCIDKDFVIERADGSWLCWDKGVDEQGVIVNKLYVLKKEEVLFDDVPKEDLIALMHLAEPKSKH